ncbi:MAG: DnaJ domain-containing protein [Thermodesulfobacteriota bacterium]|nr:DnaJ domain-containing protein [Thermodesulfobacteriota bacterium]
MAKSYYAILGISSGSTLDEIKSAYRHLSKKYHPDHYSGNRDTFLEIQEAYTVLSDDRKRNQYERQLERRPERPRRRPAYTAPQGAPEPLIPEEDAPVNLGQISPARSFETFTPSFDEIFDWLWRNFSSMDLPKSGQIRPLTLEVLLTREQARRGGTASIMVPVRAACPTCRGAGGVGFYECARCAGEGAITGEMPVSIGFPAGITDTHAVAIPLRRFGIGNMHVTVVFRVSDDY